ncbi:MAG: PTS sugar transporter subunit IIA [Kiritimatiellae bacterium]|nr:PTS sugar transporter subunit IIA [Kiritimatiellia bacterium]
MKPIINHLIQLQELVEARAQQEAVMPGTRLAELDEAIRTLVQELPQDVSRNFRRLQEKGHVAVAPIAAGVCTACGMSLPVSLVHSVRAGETILTCPSCARILFCPPEAGPRRIGQRKKRSEPTKVGIARFSSPELMIPELSAATRDDIIAELCGKLEAEGFVDNATKLAEKALNREAIASTAVDHGLAFPHVRGVEGGALTLALGLKSKGVRFVENTRSLTRIVFFVVIPTAASAFYLRLLSGLTRAFQEKDARDKLLDADSADKLWKALLSATKNTVQ